METQARYIIVGSFVLVTLLIGFLFVMWIGHSELTSEARTYDIYFEGSVTGLKEGSQVLYRGVPVGTVKSITIDLKNTDRVRVCIGVSPSTPIQEDTLATLEMQGITGLSLIHI